MTRPGSNLVFCSDPILTLPWKILAQSITEPNIPKSVFVVHWVLVLLSFCSGCFGLTRQFHLQDTLIYWFRFLLGTADFFRICGKKMTFLSQYCLLVGLFLLYNNSSDYSVLFFFLESSSPPVFTAFLHQLVVVLPLNFIAKLLFFYRRRPFTQRLCCRAWSY